MKYLIFRFVLTAYFCLVAIGASYGQSISEPMLQFPGKKTTWKGFVRYDFEFSGRTCRVVCPDRPATGIPWVWNARFPDWHTDTDSLLLARGKQELNGHHFDIDTPEVVADFIQQNTRAFRTSLQGEKFHNPRGGLAASKAIFSKEKKGRVAFLGGSITFNHGWRDSVSNYIIKRFPGTSFEFINAGIPSFGSLPDAFRVYQDVLLKGKIDLLFVEAAVNDRTNAYPAIEQVRAMEGIVRQVKISNPLTDIVFLYFADPDKTDDYNRGIIPSEIVNHEKVAYRYSIASVNLAKEVTERINNREFTWEGDFIDLHPSPFGQRVYYASISDLLKGCWDQGATVTPAMQPLPDRLDPFSYEKGRLVEIQKKNVASGWSYIRNWIPDDKASTRDGYVHVPMLIGNDPWKILKFRFKGAAVGIAVAAGPDAGIIEYSIDNKEWKRIDLFTQWSEWLHLPWYLILGDELKNGSHVLLIRLTNNKNQASKGTVCRIRYFLVN